MESAMRDIPAPPGYRRCKVPPAFGNRSSVFEHEVRFPTGDLSDLSDVDHDLSYV